MYDAIIVGASFAGLAVANQLRGRRVLLIDSKPPGEGQTSACGTMLATLEYWNLSGAVLQVHNRIVLHTRRGNFSYPSPYLWCTFDYKRLCETLFERSGAEFLRASVVGYEDGKVLTTRGAFSARYFVDASGWRAVLASSVEPSFDEKRAMNFGIETAVPLSQEAPAEGLHFWYDRRLVGSAGVGWAFPRQEEIGVGVASYRGAQSLHEPLDRMMERFRLSRDTIHGTYFPHTLRSPVAGPVFVVGDAAGMCVGLTGEGIRPALFFGEACGRVLGQVLQGEFSHGEGLERYAKFVESRRRFFDFFSRAQSVLSRLPPICIDILAVITRREPIRPWIMNRYWDLTSSWDEAPSHLSEEGFATS